MTCDARKFVCPAVDKYYEHDRAIDVPNSNKKLSGHIVTQSAQDSGRGPGPLSC